MFYDRCTNWPLRWSIQPALLINSLLHCYAQLDDGNLTEQANKYLVHCPTLESRIDVGQGISVGPGKFDKKNKRRVLNKRRAS